MSPTEHLSVLCRNFAEASDLMFALDAEEGFMWVNGEYPSQDMEWLKRRSYPIVIFLDLDLYNSRYWISWARADSWHQGGSNTVPEILSLICFGRSFIPEKISDDLLQLGEQF